MDSVRLVPSHELYAVFTPQRSVNFERLDDAVRARKALNGRDVLGSDVGAIRIGFAKVPVKGGSGDPMSAEEPVGVGVGVQGVGDLSVGATIHALRSIKGASTIPADQQVLGGAVENYRSNLLLSMIGQGTHNGVSSPDAVPKQAGWTASITEQQMIMKELTKGNVDAETDIQALAGEPCFYIVQALGLIACIYGRLPPSHHVLHHYSSCCGAAAEQALGCL